MYMYDMNVPKKKKSPAEKLVTVLYAFAGGFTVLMLLVFAFMSNHLIISLLSTAYAIVITVALLYKQMKQSAGAFVFMQKVIVYALLLLGAVIDIICAAVLPASSLLLKIVPIVIMAGAAAVSVYQLMANVKYINK